jgi:hypothetical protein
VKTLKTWVIIVLLAIATLLWIPNNALAQTSGNYVTKDQQSGQFTVPANWEARVTLTNKTNQEVKLTISAEGTWNLGHPFSNVDANSFPQSYLGDHAKGLKYPDKDPS